MLNVMLLSLDKKRDIKLTSSNSNCTGPGLCSVKDFVLLDPKIGESHIQSFNSFSFYYFSQKNKVLYCEEVLMICEIWFHRT